MKKIFTLFFVLVASVATIYASETQVNGIWYDFYESNKTATVTFRGYHFSDYDEYSGSVVIPSVVTYNGITYTVTSIGGGAFMNCSNLISVTIPNSITSIEGGAFRYCNGLKSITIPNSVTVIGEAAFLYCESLTSVTIYSDAIVNKSYENDFNMEYIFGVQVTEYIIDYVKSIGNVFRDCSGITSVSIGDNVMSIGKEAFSGCISMSSVGIGHSVTSIGKLAFSNCSSLTSVTIPNSVTSIGENVFHGCSNIKSIHVDADNPTYSSVDGVLFNKDKTILVLYPYGKQGAYTIPNSVLSIDEWAFSRCSGLTSVTMPNSVTNIGYAAFAYCSNLISSTIGNKVNNIGDMAFYNCSSLNSVTIGDNVTSIGKEAFSECTSLTSVCIPNSVTNIGNFAFYYCSGLTSVTIGTNVKNIGSFAFKGCEKMMNIFCYAITPPSAEESSFVNYDADLYVPCELLSSYQVDVIWSKFTDMQCFTFGKVETNETIIAPSNNEVKVTWPAVSGAATYELVVKDKDGNIVCTLIFNANGQLTSMAFQTPSRNGAPAQTQSAGFSFTITGLDSGTGYDLILTAKDNSGNIIEETTIPFYTNWAEGIENVQGNEVQSTKVLRDGQVLILRNGKTYTIQGQEVK